MFATEANFKRKQLFAEYEYYTLELTNYISTVPTSRIGYIMLD